MIVFILTHEPPAGLLQIPVWETMTPSYLNVTVAALGDKGDTDREKVIWLAIYAELQTTGLILYIDHRQTPLQDISPAVMAIFPI